MKRSELLQKWKDIQKSGLSRTDGGSGSGNWGHAGRPGHRGGSAGGGGKSNRVSLHGGGFTSHQRERKAWNNRFSTAFDARTPQEADDHYREQAGTVWQGLSEQSRYALYSYTSQDYSAINDPLRAHQKPDPRTKDITDAIDKCTFESDAVVYRQATYSATEKLFGLPKGSI